MEETYWLTFFGPPCRLVDIQTPVIKEVHLTFSADLQNTFLEAVDSIAESREKLFQLPAVDHSLRKEVETMQSQTTAVTRSILSAGNSAASEV